MTLTNDLGNFAFRTMKTVLLSILLILSLLAKAQDSSNANHPLLLYGLATYDIPKSYGLTIGTSIPFHSVIKDKISDDFTKGVSEKDEFVSAELGGDRRPFAYTSIIFNAGVGIRYIKSAKHFGELALEQGVQRTFYDGVVYELDTDGTIKERKLYGRTYFTTGLSYSENWSLHSRTSTLWLIQLKPFLWLQYPYNSFLKLHLSLQAGVSYRLKNSLFVIREKHKHIS